MRFFYRLVLYFLVLFQFSFLGNSFHPIPLVGGGVLGVIASNPQEVEKVEAWKPEMSLRVSSMPIVDLRFDESGRLRFPIVGHQQMQDCVAWASGYHLKTYLEAVENNWEPNSNSRIFSPSFIYNQINHGFNQGSSVYDALMLMKNTGVATLSTMPYTLDYKKFPSSKAFQEAKKYKIQNFYRLNSLKEIKTALQMENPVLVHIITDPTFNSGKYDLYTKKMRDKAIGKGSGSHGRHAMIIVGYDDTTQSLLFMNSWGANWGNKGFVRVKYDVIGNIGIDNGENFLQEAYIAIEDRSNKENTTIQDVKITGRVFFTGLEEGKPTWSWKVFIKTKPEEIDKIQSVEWVFPEQLIVNSQSNQKSNNFEATGTSGQEGKFIITAIIRYSGSQIQKTDRLSFENPKRAVLELVQTDKYYGKINKTPFWQWSLKIKGTLNDLNDIEKVIYHLHPSFTNPNPVISRSPNNGFEFSTKGWGTFPVGATVYFKDGSTKELSTNLKFQSPITDNLYLSNTAIPVGENNQGVTFYSWTIFLNGPEEQFSNVKMVRYFLHPTFNPSVVDVKSSKHGFPFSATGWGTFEIKARVFFKDGNYTDLSHNLVF